MARAVLVHVDVNQNGGSHGDIWIRCIDRNNGYHVRVANSTVDLHLLDEGNLSSLASGSHTVDESASVRFRLGRMPAVATG